LAIHWYRLLVDRAACGDLPSIGKFYGGVYFKEEEAKRCAVGDPLTQSSSTSYKSSALIDLKTYNTPWLQVQAAIYDEYGKDGLAKSSKEGIVLFIREYIEKHELDIAPSDAPDLAKFMRLAEQKAGKKYHAELKLKKLNNKQVKK
jgi:hypothetical protein